MSTIDLGAQWGPASWITLARAALAVAVAALVAGSFAHDAPVALLVTLAAIALALDLIDGWVARRTHTATAFGARFDGEVDAFLILVLSVYAAPIYGGWVLFIGMARYLFLAGEWMLPWMRAAVAAAPLAQGRRSEPRGRAGGRGRRGVGPSGHASPPRRRVDRPRHIHGRVRVVAVAQPGRRRASGRCHLGAGPAARLGRARGAAPAGPRRPRRVRAASAWSSSS